MRSSPNHEAFAARMEPLESRTLLSASVVISEFMAANTHTLHDADGDYSDWIEIHNLAASPAPLDGWYLTDSATNLMEWRFPAVSLPADGYLLVFASGKDRAVAGAELHTNFKLDSGGEYLALVRPDGQTVEWDYGPAYRGQIPDVSYGLSPLEVDETLAPSASALKVWVPTADEDESWLFAGYDDSGWISGAGGVGYERASGYQGWFGTDVGSAMYSVNSSIYTRIAFNVTDPSSIKSLLLQMKYDDGFGAYLNGEEIADANAPGDLTWNSAATTAGEASSSFVSFDVSAHRGELVVGQNILAIQGLNISAADDDMLLVPELTATRRTTPADHQLEQYFQTPTPGSANGSGTADLGPVLSSESHWPAQPADADAIVVTARAARSFHAVTTVQLHYRVMYNSEVVLTMYDDGAHGDGGAGDGVYGASIPALASTPGQMVRWYVTAADSSGATSRWPLYSDTVDSEQYFGTVIANPAVVSNLPVYQWFVQSPSDADTANGTTASLYYAGEFYDNVHVRLRGGTSGQFPKKSYKFDFPKEQPFLYSPGQSRRDEINLNTTYSDKSYVRQILSFESFRDAGAPYCEAFPIRLQQNGSFFSVSIFIEQPDKDYLQRNGLDDSGDLYKFVQGHTAFSATVGVEKKTNKDQTNPDLATFMSSLKINNATRTNYMFDHLDISECVNYLAVLYLINDGDAVRKNFYLYENLDTDQWSILPWDKDLTFGRYCGDSVLNDGISYEGEPIDSWLMTNEIANVIMRNPQTKAMYLRRVRTLYDQLFQSSSTPTAQLTYEARIDQLVSQIGNDATLDARWRPYNYGTDQSITQATDILKTQFLAPRRTLIEADPLIPAAQPAAFANEITFGTIDYNPVSANQDEEYIQLTNPNAYAVDISGWKLTSAIEYTFPDGTVIVPGGSLYVSPNPAAFRARATGLHGGQGLFVEGSYSGHLDNSGETIRLVSTDNLPINSMTYAGTQPVINEIMTNNGSGGDWIELYNPTLGSVSIGGWYLSDSKSTLQKYRIPDGTSIPAGNYLVFTEPQFGTAFGLSKDGESVCLSDAGGKLIDSDDFGGSDADVTFGRYLTANGHWAFTALASPTQGYANSNPLVGPVVMDEIMYHPPGGNDEFIELRNITDSPVSLYDTAVPSHTWTLSGGVTYILPTGVQIPAQGLLMLTGADVSTPTLKAAFKAKYSVPANVDVLGPWQGKLNNAGEDVSLNKVGPVDSADDTYPVIRADRVQYSPSYPWPTAADGTGDAMERLSLTSYGDDPFNWQSFRSSPGYPTLLQGDANRDGKVSFADYVILESNFGKSGAWSTADFNNDGRVTFADYLLLEAGFGKSVALPPGPSPASGPMGAAVVLAPAQNQVVTTVAVDLLSQARPATTATMQTQVIRGRKFVLADTTRAWDRFLWRLNLSDLLHDAL